MSNLAIGYIRVSTEDQSREGISLEVQEKRIRGYCDLHGLMLVGIYGDPGVSGLKMGNRPGLLSVLGIVERKDISHVIVAKIDRLARRTHDTLKIAEKLDQYGVALHSIMDKIDTKSAIGRFFFTMVAAMAQFESEQISERTKICLSQLKESGARYCKDAPYGWQHVPDGTRVKRLNGVDTIVPRYKRVEEPKEQACVRLLRRLHDANPGWSNRKLGRELAARGYLNRDGRVFHPKSVGLMLGDENVEAVAGREAM